MDSDGVLRPGPRALEAKEKEAERLDRAYGHGYSSGYQNGGDPPDDEQNAWDKAYGEGYRAGAADREYEDAHQPDDEDAHQPDDEPDFETGILNKLKEVTNAG
jgi:hypothetical protein